MKKSGELIRETFLNLWDGFWIIWLAQLFWVVLCIPLVTIPLAFAGIYSSIHAVAMGESTTWKTFFEGIKKNLKPAIRWTLVNLVVFMVFGFYIWFFSGQQVLSPTLRQFLEVIAISTLGLWLLINQFTFPYMLEQEKPSYRQALRNSVVTILKWPGLVFTFTVLSICVFVLSVTFRFFWVIFAASLPVFFSCTVVKYALEAAFKLQNPVTEK